MRAICIHTEPASGRERVYSAANLSAPGQMPCHQVSSQRIVPQHRAPSAIQHPHFRTKANGALILAKIERLDAEPVSHQIQPPRRQVVHRKSKHPAQLLQATRALLLPSLQQGLRIRVPSPRHWAQRPPYFEVIINLPVEGNHRPAACTHHRLCTRFAQLQDRQPHMAQPARTVR